MTYYLEAGRLLLLIHYITVVVMPRTPISRYRAEYFLSLTISSYASRFSCTALRIPLETSCNIIIATTTTTKQRAILLCSIEQRYKYDFNKIITRQCEMS